MAIALRWVEAPMCGIAGIIDKRAPNLDGELGQMLSCFAHRGPDGQGTHIASEFGLALGMRRLSIIDLVNGWQPIWNEDGSLCAIFNGEIYNYLELGRELKAKGHNFRTSADGEVLVHLYEELGE